MERLEPFLVEEARLAAGTFNERTGLGNDALRPRHIRLLSDGAVFCLWHFMYAADVLGY